VTGCALTQYQTYAATVQGSLTWVHQPMQLEKAALQDCVPAALWCSHVIQYGNTAVLYTPAQPGIILGLSLN